MKERPNLEEVIADIQKMIDESQRSYIRYIHVGTLMDILYLLKEREPKPITITTNEYGMKFYHCPNCNKTFYEPWELYKDYCYNCGQAVKWE